MPSETRRHLATQLLSSALNPEPLLNVEIIRTIGAVKIKSISRSLHGPYSVTEALFPAANECDALGV